MFEDVLIYGLFFEQLTRRYGNYRAAMMMTKPIEMVVDGEVAKAERELQRYAAATRNK